MKKKRKKRKDERERERECNAVVRLKRRHDKQQAFRTPFGEYSFTTAVARELGRMFAGNMHHRHTLHMYMCAPRLKQKGVR